MRSTYRLLAIVPLSLLLLLGGCRKADTAQKILEQRVLWNVQILNWAQEGQGAITISSRILGPPNSDLEHLTIKLDLVDEAGTTIKSVWHSFDLAQAPRGGPADLIITIPDFGHTVDSLLLDRVYEPTAVQRTHIKELQP